MRPSIFRPFSTTRRIAQQQLYETYIPELNETQRAAIRKAARANAPNFHGHFNKDAGWLLKVYSRSESQKMLLKETLDRVRTIVKQHAGPNCDVEDISMHTYSRHVHDAPFEFAIVDKSRPDGVSPEEASTELPIVYDAARFAEILMQEGFTGGFWAPPWDMGRMHQSFASNEIVPPTERGLTVPWPHYRRSSLVEFHYPVRLITYSPVAFSLSLPGPSVMRLNRLIKNYFNFRETLQSLTAMLFIWTRSHRMDEFTPQCLALIAIRFMQELGKVPNLMDPDHPWFRLEKNNRKSKSQTASKMWMPFQHLVSHPDDVDPKIPREYRLEITQLAHTITNPTSVLHLQQKPGSLFWDFLRFWRNGLPIARMFALSAGQNKYIRRQLWAINDRQHDLPVSRVFEMMERSARVKGYDPTSTKYDPQWQSFSWRLQSLVVQDPFIPTYNHAESVSRETMHTFVRQAQMKSRDLAHSWPFTTAFGEYFEPPREEKAETFRRRRNYDMAFRRHYHTDAVRPKPPIRPQVTEPPKPALVARAKTISRVQTVIQKKYGKQYRVQAFGSTEYGVSSANSDLDLVVIDSARMNGFPPHIKLTGLPEIYDVKKLSRVLLLAGFKNVDAIVNASVPIVKFRDKTTGLDCDINVNEQLGRLNTGMIKRYCDIVTILRPMIAFIKRWAKPLGLNNPGIKRGSPSFSSYALMLMCISYLQSRGLAPNLQSGLEHNPESDDGYFWIRKKSKKGDAKRVRCDTRYHLGHGWAAKEKVTYEDALVGWFQYWGNEHCYSKSVASIRQGGFVLKRSEMQQAPNAASEFPIPNGVVSKMSESWLQVPLCVVDPFIRKKVVTQAINQRTVDLFRLNCLRTVKLLGWGVSLEDVVEKRGKKKPSKKLPKIPNAPPAGLKPTSSFPATELQENRSVEVDTVPDTIYAEFSPKTMQQYPGAVAHGTNERTSSVLEADHVFIDDEDTLELEESDIPSSLDLSPKYPRRTLPEFEPEGFGIKEKDHQQNVQHRIRLCNEVVARENAANFTDRDVKQVIGKFFTK